MVGKKRWLKLTALPGGVLALGAVLSVTAALAATATVNIGDDYYSPRSTTVQAGDAVVWTNTGDSVHTITSDTGAFDSSFLRTGESWRFTFLSPGTYAYHCEVHGRGQAGTIVVQAAATAPPPQPTEPPPAAPPPPADSPPVAPIGQEPAPPVNSPPPADGAFETPPGDEPAPPADSPPAQAVQEPGTAPLPAGSPPGVPAAGFGPLATEGPALPLVLGLTALGAAILATGAFALGRELRRRA